MIPTLYDYWVHDVEVLREKGRYELYPNNPYETVINTRPAISFYNDNNPDWLNVMIFYHVLAHIDFFQNNVYFRNTWDCDFTGQALSDKRMIAKLRSEKGRWVDYVIEFTRGIDNLVGFHWSCRGSIHRPGRHAPECWTFISIIFLQNRAAVQIGRLYQGNRTVQHLPAAVRRTRGTDVFRRGDAQIPRVQRPFTEKHSKGPTRGSVVI